MLEPVFSSEEYFKNLNNFFTSLSQIYKNAEEAYKKELHHFFEVLKNQYKLVETVEEGFNLRFGANFNVVEIFQPDEVRLSKVIAELLNPKGMHGQKETFLKCFIKKLKEIFKEVGLKEPLSWLKENLAFREIIEVFTEVDIGKGRIDILVKFGRGTSGYEAIAIENKPWAGEQKNQLKRYVEYLKNSSEYSNYLLIFLAEEGREAYSLGKDEKERRKEKERLKAESKFLELFYNRFLKEWIKDCLKECEAEKVRLFLKDFLFWIEKNFPEKY